jgi:hypothetical protein
LVHRRQVNNMKLRTTLIITVILVLALLGGVWYIYYSTHHMLVIKAQPSLSNVPDGQIATASTYVDYFFNKKIDSASVNTGSIFSDQNIISTIDVRDQSIRVYIHNLNKDQKYSIYLQNIKSTDGFILNQYVYSVTAVFIKNYTATKEEQKQQNSQTDSTNNSNPIFAVVPYQTLDYSITAGGTITNSNTPPSISIFINLTAADYNDAHPNTIIEAKRQLARNYLIAKGIDLSKYTIVYSQTPNNYAN